jgi:hypothetical protein
MRHSKRSCQGNHSIISSCARLGVACDPARSARGIRARITKAVFSCANPWVPGPSLAEPVRRDVEPVSLGRELG